MLRERGEGRRERQRGKQDNEKSWFILRTFLGKLKSVLAQSQMTPGAFLPCAIGYPSPSAHRTALRSVIHTEVHWRVIFALALSHRLLYFCTGKSDSYNTTSVWGVTYMYSFTDLEIWAYFNRYPTSLGYSLVFDTPFRQHSSFLRSVSRLQASFESKFQELTHSHPRNTYYGKSHKPANIWPWSTDGEARPSLVGILAPNLIFGLF